MNTTMPLAAFHAVPSPMTTLENMPPFNERERVGLELRRLRKEANIETAKAAELGGISVAQLGNIERGQHSLTSISAGGLSRLPSAFGLTWSSFVKVIAPVYGPYIALIGTRPAETPQDLQGLTPYAPNKTVRHLGKVSAGRLGSEVYSYIEARKIPDNILDGHDSDNCFTLEVTGDSMMDADARFEIKDGATVVINSALSPQPGDIVSVWLIEEDIGVLKMFKPQSDHVVLESLNREHLPIVLTDEMPAIMQGVMIGNWTPRQRHRRR